MHGAKPEDAVIGGLMRAMITEMPHVEISTIDLDVDYDQLSRDIADIILTKQAELRNTGNKA